MFFSEHFFLHIFFVQTLYTLQFYSDPSFKDGFVWRIASTRDRTHNLLCMGKALKDRVCCSLKGAILFLKNYITETKNRCHFALWLRSTSGKNWWPKFVALFMTSKYNNCTVPFVFFRKVDPVAVCRGTTNLHSNINCELLGNEVLRARREKKVFSKAGNFSLHTKVNLVPISTNNSLSNCADNGWNAELLIIWQYWSISPELIVLLFNSTDD